MKKKIVFFVGSMGRGGAERVVSILSQYYVEKGWDVDIGMLLHNNSDYILNEKVRVIDFSHNNQKKIFGLLKMLKSVRNYIKNESPNIVVPFLAKISALTYLALLGSKKRDFRLISSERIDPYQVNNPLILRWLIDKSFMKADCVVFQTKRAKSFYKKSIQDKSVIIGNPVSMRLTHKNNPDKCIINAGRLTKQKNQRMLIEAFAMIVEQYPEYKLCIYGEGELRKELQEYVNEKKLNDRILLPGNLIDYPEKLSSAEIFVLSSDYEGLSNALLEAMMMGTPCISTDCAGSDEVIKNGENGILVPVGDAVALSNALKKLLDNKELQNEMGKNAYATAIQFKTENVIKEWENVFEKELF